MDFEIRVDRHTPQGRKKLTREREAYFQLMHEGYSNYQACRIVGIDRRTGMRWRNGTNPVRNRKGSPPDARAGASGSGLFRVARVGPRFLRQADRLHIADRLREGASLRTIARELGRSPSTISREVRRNAHPGSGAYRPHAAQARADERRPRPKTGKIAQNTELRAFVQDQLDRRWSPEQICHALKKRFPDRPEMHVAHETIYQALYIQGRGALRRDLTRALRTGRARRRPHRQATVRQPRFAHTMVMISERPAEVRDRAVPGHWEGDLIIGGREGRHSAIGTLVERTSRFLMLIHLPDNRHRAEHFHQALTEALGGLPPLLRRSLTWDQGNEMAQHRSFSLATDIPVYFCDPASPWQRGSNENTNGLLRQYFPKGTDLAIHDRQTLDAVAAELNSRPRKTLGWETPAERLAKLLATSN